MADVTILCHGVFDVLHVGHLRLLEEAAKLGDHLVVSITADEYVGKGPGRPINHQSDRARMVAALPMVDQTIVSFHRSAAGVIHDIKPDIYVKGKEYMSEDVAGNLESERVAVQSHGGKVVFIDTGEDTRSSSNIINRHQPTITSAAAEWVQLHNFTWKDVAGWLDRAASRHVTVAGEVIMDKYEYVIPHGKSPKEPVITWTADPDEEPEQWVGGSNAVLEHVRSAGISNYRLAGNLADPVIKQRDVHKPFMTKIHSTAHIPAEFKPLVLDDCDVLIVTDFGHGLFPRKRALDAKFKALTVQSNSLNWGMNRINKWMGVRFDFLACDMKELQLAVPDMESIEHGIETISKRIATTYTLVTLGHEGAVFYDGHFHQVPAFTDSAVDRIGAGDAFLGSVTSLLAEGAPPEVVMLVGSCAAALHVQKPGNGVASKAELYGFLKAVLS